MISPTWLLLSDSALPLGSFAFSSSLESHIAHHASIPARTLLPSFLRHSLLSLATTTLPFLIATFHAPSLAASYDDALDASTPCAVARRASVSQGRALMSVWDKSLRSLGAGEAVEAYKAAIRRGEASGHFGVAWAVVCSACSEGLDLDDVCFVFLFSHAKAVVSAAVRLGVIGPYQAQAVLAAEETRADIRAAIEVGRALDVEEVGQAVPTLDLYQGRHELLYSRVFNS